MCANVENTCSSLDIDFITHKSVGSQYKVTFPKEAQNRLLPDGRVNGKRAHWNINEDHQDVVISTVELKENHTLVKEFTEIDKNGLSVVIPKLVRKKIGINEGDDVYFVGVVQDNYPTPAVFMWTFERMESMATEWDNNQPYEYLRYPGFI